MLYRTITINVHVADEGDADLDNNTDREDHQEQYFRDEIYAPIMNLLAGMRPIGFGLFMRIEP